MVEFIVVKQDSRWHLARLIPESQTSYRLIHSVHWSTQEEAVNVAEEINHGDSTDVYIPNPTDSTPEPEPEPEPEPVTFDLTQPNLGVNLSSVTYWATQIPFNDFFKMSMNQGSKEWGDWNSDTKDLTMDLDEKGWVKSLKPGQTASAIIFRNGGHYPAGDYYIQANGEGKIDFEGDDFVFDGTGTKFVKTVTPDSNGLMIRIEETNPDNYLRDISIGLVGSEPGWYPGFVQTLSPFSTLRFMDWGETNGNRLINWSDRTPLDYRTQHAKEKGVAYEYMIHLANDLKQHPWFCIPHQADDTFIRNFAELVADQLDPNLHVLVEYSNEVWNGMFDQHNYAVNRGDPWYKFYVDQTHKIANIWKDVLGDRVSVVLSGHSANSWLTGQMMDLIDVSLVDAFAIAPYFGGKLGRDSATIDMTVDQVLDACENDINTRIKDDIQAQLDKSKLPLIAYEGGQHLVGVGHLVNEQQLTNLFHQANRHPRMAELYKAYLDQWKSLGGGLFALFSDCSNPSKWGSWGLKEYQDQSDAVKYQAVLDWLS